MADTKSGGGKVTTKLVALSSAGVVAVYAAGFYRTKAAADRLAEADAERRRPEVVPIDPARLQALESRPVPPTGKARSVTPEPEAPAVTFTLPTRPAPQRSEPSAPSTGASSAAVGTAQPGQEAPSTPAKSEPLTSTAPEAPAPAPAEAAAVPQSGQPAAADLQQPPASLPTPRPFAAYKDGTYLGWGSCRHGDIQASVTLAAGRITEAKVAQCWTRYSCNWIDPIVPQVVARQSPNVDYVSGATQSVDAFYWAVIDALSKAK